MIPAQAELNVEYDVIAVGGNIAPAIEWCIENFGPPGSRWFISNYRFYFANNKDAVWFELRF